ncbi:cytochrome C oxidase subunit III [Echinicola sp. 20G]|uniref:cytochrome c oxidase subunit 3 n=1 Tax=Echinicola sp. 20G TaxID=2781961 RepID=UPI001910082D|nr:cytochrome C oxidase subunit III [Echinicola sp. 20G]
MKTKTDDGWIQKMEKMHPYQTIVYLGMIGSGLIFLFLTIAFLSSFYPQNNLEVYQLPTPFWLSTFVLVASSFLINRLIHFYHKGRPYHLERFLWVIFSLGLLFTALQFWGWSDLNQQGIDFTGIPSGSYLFVLTGIHILHLLGVLIFVIVLLWEVHQSVLDPVKDLVFITNPFVKMKLKLFITYWHFVDFIWLLLFILFSIAF